MPPSASSTDEGGQQAEKHYLLCLLNVAEELLALMPAQVQRKYGLIKGTLAVKLGSAVDLDADSAILASLTSGIRPQVSSLTPNQARVLSRDVSVDRRPHFWAGAEGGGSTGIRAIPSEEGQKAAVARSLHSQLMPEGDLRCELVAAPARRAQEQSPHLLQEKGEDGVRDGEQLARERARGQEQDRARQHETTMMRHHLRVLRTCIANVRAAPGNTGDLFFQADGTDPASSRIKNAAAVTVDGSSGSEGMKQADTPAAALQIEGGAVIEHNALPHPLAASAAAPPTTLDSEHDALAPTAAASHIPVLTAPAPLEEEHTASATEILMGCSEAFGTLQVQCARMSVSVCILS